MTQVRTQAEYLTTVEENIFAIPKTLTSKQVLQVWKEHITLTLLIHKVNIQSGKAF